MTFSCAKRYKTKTLLELKMTTPSLLANELIVCIYTCEEHKELLRQFHKSVLGQYFRSLEGVRVFEVYANPDIQQSDHNNNKLVLRTEEKYEALSLKTYEMIDYCVRHFDFKHLLKIDVAVIRTSFEGAEYEGREPVDLDKLMGFLKEASFDSDYDGFTFFSNVRRKDSENWAAKKGGVIDFEKVFGESTHLPPFYRGLCYTISKRFSQYISQHGRTIAEEHEKYYLGAEDVMVGRLYGKFQKSLL